MAWDERCLSYFYTDVTFLARSAQSSVLSKALNSYEYNTWRIHACKSHEIDCNRRRNLCWCHRLDNEIYEQQFVSNKLSMSFIVLAKKLLRFFMNCTIFVQYLHEFQRIIQLSESFFLSLNMPSSNFCNQLQAIVPVDML